MKRIDRLLSVALVIVGFIHISCILSDNTTGSVLTYILFIVISLVWVLPNWSEE